MTTTTAATTVIGAGLGGLTLACVLQKQGKQVTIYEAEAHRDARPQGGVLDMHEGSGQAALSACGLTKEFERLVIAGRDQMRVLDKFGKALFEDTNKDTSQRPEIDRLHLRGILIDALQPDTIQWNHKLQSVEPSETESGKAALTFTNGKRIACGRLVGADGAWSKVRNLLSDTKPTYTGVCFVEFHIRNVEAHPEAAATVGKGSLFAIQDNVGIIGHRHGDGSIQLYAAFRGPEDVAQRVTKTSLLDTLTGWDERLRNLVRQADDSFTPRPLYALPVGFTWQHRPGVTLLGDAAHVMSPFAGEGANLAMIDGADLANMNDWQAYETKMWQRSAIAAEESARNLDTCIAPRGSQAMADMMRGFTQSEGA